MNSERWVAKVVFNFQQKRKLKLTKIFNFHFPNSQKNELALGYTHLAAPGSPRKRLIILQNSRLI